MSTAAVVQKLVQRAKQAEEIIAQLKAQIENVKQVAAISVSKPEEERLRVENEQLRTKINTLKTTLILCEIKNGVKQIPIPLKKAKLEAAGPSDTANTAPPSAVTTEPKPEAAKGGKPQKEKQGKGEQPNKKKGDETDKPKKGKAEKDTAADADRPIDISRLDLRVGKIVGVKKHPDADSLYVEDVDLGEGQTRTIVSGLVKHVPIEEMQDRLAVFMCNLKPAKMRGIMSQGMIMCASCPEKVEILLPPPGAQIGDRVFAKDYPGEPDALMNPKKKIWETVKPDLVTDATKVASYKGSQLIIEGKGPVVAPTRANTQIS